MSRSTLLLAAILSFIAVAPVHAEEQPLTPQQVTSLFFRTLLQGDREAMAALNAYEQPARDATSSKGPFIDIQKMMETDAIYAKELARQTMQRVNLDEKDKAVLMPDAIAMFQAIRDAQKRTACTFGEVRPSDARMPKGYKTVTVDFTCLAVSPKEKITSMIRRSLQYHWNSLDMFQEGFQGVAQDYSSAPVTYEFSGRFPLTSTDEPTIWQNTFPRETLKINDVLY